MKKLLSMLVVFCMATGSMLAQVVVEADLQNALQSSTSPVTVVVTFKGDGAPSSANLALLQSLGITKGLTFHSLPIAGVLANATQVNGLAASPQVLSVELNKQLTYYNFNDTNLTGVQRLRADKTMTARNNGMPVSGKGITVMINDSGIDGTHDDIKLGTHLVQNVMGTTNLNGVSSVLPVTYLENVPNTDTNSGHGTHCAGSVGGNGAKSSGKYEGAAPGAKLVGYGSGGALFILDAIGGFDYALTHQYEYGIRVISNSWGTSGKFKPFHAVNIASKKAYDRGIVSLFAAGNDGPGSDTHNPYAIAPWVISIGAGDKNGKLAGFSSRGVKDEGGSFVIDGETWTYENRPTAVAPGVDVISTRVIAPVSSLGAQKDAEVLEPAHIPFYTHMSGTSMATPLAAGIVALMLEAKPSLSPAQIKEIMQKTATNMPGRESWEVGAGYVNAYAAVDHIFRNTSFGSSLNYTRAFNSKVNSTNTQVSFTIDFNPATTATNQTTFNVAAGTTSLEAKVMAGGVSGETGNPVNLSLFAPDGKEYRSGISALFTLYQDRGVAVANPMAGTWTIRLTGLNGVAIPEKISGNVKMLQTAGSTGMNDIAGHAAESSIKTAISSRLMDGVVGGFKPDNMLKRLELADYLMMGQAVRQFMPTSGVVSFSDLSGTDLLIAESVTAKGAALRDRFHAYKGLVLTGTDGKFNPNATVNRAEVAYSLVQSLGLEEFAMQRMGKAVTVKVDGKDIAIDDAATIPAGLEGYVSIALELNLINAYFSVTQGPYDILPVLRANFKPTQEVTRADYAVIVTRTFNAWTAVTQPIAVSSSSSMQIETDAKSYSYPNPFRSVTTITYAVEKAGPVSVVVYDIMGKKVKTLVSESQKAGKHEVKFDGSKLPVGTYLYKVDAGGQVTSSKMIIMN